MKEFMKNLGLKLKQFFKKNWLHVVNGVLYLTLLVIGAVYVKKNYFNSDSNSNTDDLDSRRKSNERRTDSGFDRIESTIGDLEEHNSDADRARADVDKAIRDLGDSVEELSGNRSQVPAIIDSIEDRIRRNKELIHRLQRSGESSDK